MLSAASVSATPLAEVKSSPAADSLRLLLVQAQVDEKSDNKIAVMKCYMKFCDERLDKVARALERNAIDEKAKDDSMLAFPVQRIQYLLQAIVEQHHFLQLKFNFLRAKESVTKQEQLSAELINDRLEQLKQDENELEAIKLRIFSIMNTLTLKGCDDELAVLLDMVVDPIRGERYFDLCVSDAIIVVRNIRNYIEYKINPSLLHMRVMMEECLSNINQFVCQRDKDQKLTDEIRWRLRRKNGSFSLTDSDKWEFALNLRSCLYSDLRDFDDPHWWMIANFYQGLDYKKIKFKAFIDFATCIINWEESYLKVKQVPAGKVSDLNIYYPAMLELAKQMIAYAKYYYLPMIKNQRAMVVFQLSTRNKDRNEQFIQSAPKNSNFKFFDRSNFELGMTNNICLVDEDDIMLSHKIR